MFRHVSDLSSALQSQKELAQRLAGKQHIVFLDYDGTLTPIVENPQQALLAEPMREKLKALAQHCTVAIVSGRDLADVRRLVGLDQLFYAGNHGFHICGPHGSSIHHQEGSEFHLLMMEVEAELCHEIGSIEGLLVENKRVSVVAHFRQVCESDRPKISKAVESIIHKHPELRLGFGKMVYEILPRIDWHKGKAVLWLLKALGMAGDDVIPIYIGDDITDEDAFQAVSGRGIGIFVGDIGNSESQHVTSAHFKVKNPDEVGLLLQFLV